MIKENGQEVVLFTIKEMDTLLKVLSDWGKVQNGYDGFWHGYTALEDLTQMPIKRLKPIMKFLKNQGICRYCETYNSDYIISGKGYFLQAVHHGKTWEEIRI